VLNLKAGTNMTLTDNGSGQITFDAAGGGGGGGLTQLAQTTVAGSSTNSITFSTISGSYSNLEIWVMARSDLASNHLATMYIQFNTDTAAHYNHSVIYAGGSGVGQFNSTSTAQPEIFNIPAASASANVAAGVVIYIPAYAGTTFYKNATAPGYTPDFSSGQVVALENAQWSSTAAVTSVTLGLQNATAHFVAGSVFTLYGLQ